jgi:hypothetical protein
MERNMDWWKRRGVGRSRAEEADDGLRRSRRGLIAGGGAAAAAGIASGALGSQPAGAQTPGALDDLTDVDTTGQTPGDQLGYDGALWRPVVAPEIAAGPGIQLSTAAGLTTISAVPADGDVVITPFNASGTWVVPSVGTLVVFQVWGSGGGGGSGRRGAAGTVCGGGGGGAAGSFTERQIGRQQLDGLTLTITVGQGGAGGAAPSATNANGVTGADGAATSVTTAAGGIVASASGGRGGVGGTTAAGVGGGFGATGTLPGMRGLPGGAAAASAAAGLEWLTGLLLDSGDPFNYIRRAPAGAGGGGGGLTAANAPTGGSSGCLPFDYWPRWKVGAAGTAAALNGGDYAEHPVGSAPIGSGFGGGVGGGGGFSHATGTSGRGGHGSPRGGGGGGGAAGRNGGAAGAGGNGGAGFVRIIVF